MSKLQDLKYIADTTVIKLIRIFNATAFLAVLLNVFNKKGSLNSAPPKPIKPPKQPIGPPIANAKRDVFLSFIFLTYGEN
jgi:hypothetical protein